MLPANSTSNDSKSKFDQPKSELADVQAKAVQLKASIVYYEGMLALVVPNEVASTPTEMLSETEALILNGGQVASTSSLGADEHLKRIPRKQDKSTPEEPVARQGKSSALAGEPGNPNRAFTAVN